MNLIACISKNNGIGYENNLLFNIPDDMKHFKELTLNNIVVMGRKTLFTFKNKEPLSNRINIVLTKNTDIKNKYKNFDNIFFTADKNDTINLINKLTEKYPNKKVFIIGGETIYNLFFNEVDTFYLTRVYEERLCDTYLPELNDNDFYIAESGDIKEYNNIKYNFLTYKRK